MKLTQWMNRCSSLPQAPIKTFEKPKLADMPQDQKGHAVKAIVIKIAELLAALGVKKGSDDFTMALTYLKEALIVDRAKRVSFSSILLFLHMIKNGIKPFNVKLYGLQPRDIVLKFEEFIEWQQKSVADNEKNNIMNIQQRTIKLVQAMKQNGGEAKIKELQDKWTEQENKKLYKKRPYSYHNALQLLNSKVFSKNASNGEFEAEKTQKEVEDILENLKNKIWSEKGLQLDDGDEFEKALFNEVNSLEL